MKLAPSERRVGWGSPPVHQLHSSASMPAALLPACLLATESFHAAVFCCGCHPFQLLEQRVCLHELTTTVSVWTFVGQVQSVSVWEQSVLPQGTPWSLQQGPGQSGVSQMEVGESTQPDGV